MKRKIISGLLVLILLLTIVVPSIAATKSELENEKSNAQSKANEANKAKRAVTAEKETVLNEIADLEDEISQYESELKTLNSKIKKLEEEIKTKGTEIEKLQKEFEEMQQLLTDRLVAIYEEGQITMLDVFLSADSFWEFLSMPTRLQELTEADNSQMDKVEKQRQQVEKAKKELEEQQTQLSNDKKSAEQKQKQLETAKASKEKKAANLTAEQKKLQAEINKYNKAIKDLDAKLKKLNENASGQYQGNFNGVLSWPISSSSPGYNIITSYFGNRTSPTPGASSNHRGIDIGVAYQSIYAPADGYVLLVERNHYGYGNYIIIKHANNLYTGFKHLSAVSVSTGQRVTRGQKIGTSGNTGAWSSGPHLHFEVRIAMDNYYQDTVNPLNYTHW